VKRILLLLLLSTPVVAGTFDDDATRLARWTEIRGTIFAAKRPQVLIAPGRVSDQMIQTLMAISSNDQIG